MELSSDQHDAIQAEYDRHEELRAKDEEQALQDLRLFARFASQYDKSPFDPIRTVHHELTPPEPKEPVRRIAATVAEAAKMTGRSENHIRNAIRTGKLAAEGETDYRIHLDSVHAWVKCGTKRDLATVRVKVAPEASGRAAGERALAMFRARRAGSA